MKSGIYLIKNKVNYKIYIGSSINIYRRWNQHIIALNSGTHVNKHLQRAWDKYGKNNFKFSILELTDYNNLILVEQNYIDNFDACNINKGYNICPRAGSALGRKMPEGFQIGNKNHRYGVKFSDETKHKISVSLKGRHPSQTSINKMKQTLTGRKLSDEARKSISEGHKGKILSEETKLKIGLGNKGKVRSDDCKRKISEKNKGRKFSTETKNKMSLSRKGLQNNCKIPNEKVPVILKMLNDHSVKEISKIFNVSIGTIYFIKSGKREWR